MQKFTPLLIDAAQPCLCVPDTRSGPIISRSDIDWTDIGLSFGFLRRRVPRRKTAGQPIQMSFRHPQASLASLVCERPEPSTRTLDAGIGGTSNTVSPAATSWRASKKPSPLADSTAHCRFSKSLAQSQRRRAWPVDARSVNSSSTTSLLSIATAVWVALCGSIPVHYCHSNAFRFDYRTVAGTPDSG